MSFENNRYAGLKMLYEGAHSSGGLAIKAGASALAKTVSAIKYFYNGALKSIGASDMAALSGSVTNAKYNVYVFSAEKADGTLHTDRGTEATTLAGVEFPVMDSDRVVLGWVEIHPTGTGNFVGGTTALDNGTVVPNAVYVNAYGIPYPRPKLVE